MSGNENSNPEGMEKINISTTVVAGPHQRMLARVRDHEILMDGRKEWGGDNAGPTPPECLALGLGGCIINICRILALQKGIVLEDLEVSVTGDIDPSRAFGLKTDVRAGFSHLMVRLEAASTLSEAEKEDFRRELFERCPLCDTVGNVVPLQVIF
jgi:putative redox protein